MRGTADVTQMDVGIAGVQRIAVIIVAAGRGERFGGDGPKQYMELAGRTLIRHAVDVFAAHPAITDILPVIHTDDTDLCADALAGCGPTVMSPVRGGVTRQASVLNGLRALMEVNPAMVLVHDAARPLVPVDVIDAVIHALAENSGAVPGLAVVDTLKRTDDTGNIAETVPRTNMWQAQTPQGFRYDLLLAAHEAAVDATVTDDAQIMELAGHKVIMVPGAVRNLKVTTVTDMERLDEIMRQNSHVSASRKAPRIGTGYDVHRLGRGRGVTLCGVEIACDMALIGHSDADVAMHALTDAILGAVGAGDIGSHFPPTDDRWRGASSDVFLKHACTLVSDAGFMIGNVDVTIICERPKVGPHRDEMRLSLAKIMGIEASNISVKATTTEKLGFTGRGEGIAAQASAMLVSAA